MHDSREGKLLIAHPNLPSSDYFYRSVILIYAESKQDGTLGIIVNRPTDQTVGELCATYNVHLPSPNPVKIGGPISNRTICMLHSIDWTSTSTKHISGKSRLAITSDSLMFEKMSMGDRPAYWLCSVGLCAWAPGQLDKELTGKRPYRPENSWLTCDANDHILFELEGEEQWKTALDYSSRQMINQFF